jgi:hypothetical protein
VYFDVGETYLSSLGQSLYRSYAVLDLIVAQHRVFGPPNYIVIVREHDVKSGGLMLNETQVVDPPNGLKQIAIDVGECNRKLIWIHGLRWLRSCSWRCG